MSIKLNYLRQILSRSLIHTHMTRGCDPCMSICVLRLFLGIISYTHVCGALCPQACHSEYPTYSVNVPVSVPPPLWWVVSNFVFF